MGRYVLGFHEVDGTQVARVGGKGAHLGELARIEGIRVPPGFCLSTDAYLRVLEEAPSIDDRLERLAQLRVDDREGIRKLSYEIRQAIEGASLPDDLEGEIVSALAQLGETAAYAVRSSATAEDSQGASFAGLHDTYLQVVGSEEVLRHVRRCWASLFSERAVVYRIRRGFDHRKVHMAVVVQRMVHLRVAGVLFTADPVTSNRKVASVEAVLGLGEALVSGRVNADTYEVRDGEVVSRQVASKRIAHRPSPSGGTYPEAIEPTLQDRPALTDAQVVRLVALGRRIEARFGSPQDVEWCLADDGFDIVQSRPISALFPIPTTTQEGNRVYVSVGHQQMMTDAMKPLGLSLWRLTSPAPMVEAGGRLFVDVTGGLASPSRRAALLGVLGRSDPLIGDALRTIIERGDFVREVPDEAPAGPPPAAPPPGRVPPPIETDPALVAGLIERSRASLEALRQEIREKSGVALLDFILEDLQALRRMLFDPQSLGVILAAMDAARWLDENLEAWLGEKGAADTLTRSVPGNVTSEMGLALLDVADAIRPHPEVVAALERAEDEDFLEELLRYEGGQQARDAMQAWLDVYGMRCVGEIDVTRPRWSERPTMLLPTLLGHVRNLEPGAGKRRFEEGRQEAARKEEEVLERLRALPEGEQRAEEVRRMIDRLRTFIGYREYPKYAMVCRYSIYKEWLLREAERLMQAKVLREKEDIFHLTLPELRDVVRTQEVDERLLHERKEAYESYRSLQPPRVLTSDGEVVAGSYRRDGMPAGALVGLPVSAGTVEGRARIVIDMSDADLEPGDILVTACTDPSWTPLFLGIQGLVAEVGGQMTHGAVIAREYGLPAVVGVEDATRRIRDGQRIRVHGGEGFVELLD